MKCQKCNSEMRMMPQQVSVDANGNPIFHTFALCDTCRYQMDLSAVPVKKDNHTGIIVVAVIAVILLSASYIGRSAFDVKMKFAEKREELSAQAVVEPVIEYTTVSITDLIEELDANALRASETYKDKYIEITGVLSNVDASGKYINIKESEDDYSFTNIQCYIQDEDQKARAMEYNTGDTVTLKGQITDVGEFIGYSIDIIEFE